jgi:spermidine synthase
MLYAKIISGQNEVHLKVEDILYHQHSPYQEILVADFPKIRKTLILDDELQSCSTDYEAYHNALIVPYSPQNHERVLVIGAGEGVLVDKLLRASWKHVDAVELDPNIPVMADECLSDWNNHIYKRTDEFNLIIDDGLSVLKRTPDEHYSYIVFDLTSQAILSNQAEWIAHIHRCLLPNGLLTAQDGQINDPSYLTECVKRYFDNEPIYRANAGWRFLHCVKKP